MQKIWASCGEPLLLCGTKMDVSHCDGNIARDMKIENIYEVAEEDLSTRYKIGLARCLQPLAFRVAWSTSLPSCCWRSRMKWRSTQPNSAWHGFQSAVDYRRSKQKNKYWIISQLRKQTATLSCGRWCSSEWPTSWTANVFGTGASDRRGHKARPQQTTE